MAYQTFLVRISMKDLKARVPDQGHEVSADPGRSRYYFACSLSWEYLELNVDWSVMECHLGEYNSFYLREYVTEHLFKSIL